MNAIYKAGLLGLVMVISGCGNDVEIKTHNDKNLDFSNYQGALIDAKKIKGTFLDREYVEGIVTRISSAESAVSSHHFLRNNPEPLKVLDQHIESLSTIDAIDTAALVRRLEQHKVNIEQYLQAENQRKKLTIERLEKDINPLFTQLDTTTAQLNEYLNFLKPVMDDVEAKKLALTQQKEITKKLNTKTEQAIDQYIVDKEIPISINSVGLKVVFNNIDRFRDGQTCNEDRKAKADYRATLMTASTGEIACSYDYQYKLSYNKYRVKLDAQTKSDLNLIITQAQTADRDQYIKLGYAERMYDQARNALQQKETIATNKFGRSLDSVKNALNSIKREIARYPDGLINEDRTLNLESQAFAKAMRYTRGVNSVRINTDTRIFRDYNQTSDLIYSKKIKQQLEQSLIKFEVDKAGFDLPEGIEQKDIAYLFINSKEHVSGQKSAYLWNSHSLRKNEGELRLNDHISSYYSNRNSILETIHQDIY